MQKKKIEHQRFSVGRFSFIEYLLYNIYLFSFPVRARRKKKEYNTAQPSTSKIKYTHLSAVC